MKRLAAAVALALCIGDADAPEQFNYAEILGGAIAEKIKDQGFPNDRAAQVDRLQLAH